MTGCRVCAYTTDIFSSLINQLLEDHKNALPNLGHIQVLLPELTQSQQFRTRLLDKTGLSALVPPRLNTLRGWIEEQTPPTGRILNTHARELMLVETLYELEPFGEQSNPWMLTDSLLRLFDELQLSEHSAENLTDLFSGEHELSDQLTQFSEAAQKIKLLWHDFETQQAMENTTDRISLYRLGLDRLIQQTDNISGPVYLAGINWLHSRELQLVRRLLETGKLTVLLRPEQPLWQQLESVTANYIQVEKHIKNENSHFLNTVFNSQNNHLKQRAESIAEQIPASPFKDHVQIFSAASDEQEAQAIDLQTRIWLLTGKQRIAIVTEDRRLARRVSALLQNAGLSVQDSAGWPLSTTTAAGIFERWLSTLEADFFYLPLLDVLKSGFLASAPIKIEAVYHFQRDIIEREQLVSNLEKYRRLVRDRRQRLDYSEQEYSDDMLQLLEHVEHAAKPLLTFLQGRHKPAALLDALSESLHRLGLHTGFAADPAGQRILQELEDLQQSLDGRNVTTYWSEFRIWLQRALETHNFRPGSNDGHVEIINFNQSNTGQYDALIIAAATADQLPGNPVTHDFFNDNVRRELGLRHRDVHRRERYSQFTRLLLAAGEVLITWNQLENGEPKLPSPWVELLAGFHEQAYGDDLTADQLQQLLRQTSTQVQPESPAPLPEVTTRPTPSLPEQQIPRQLSASAHQNLIDCPYRFFAAHGLELKPREEISELLSKRDYGTLVHQCLQSYHSHVGSSRDLGRDAAIAELTVISKKIFFARIETDFEGQSWWLTWQEIIPRYIDWQIKREENWLVKYTEHKVRKKLKVKDFNIAGRIDRADSNPEGLSLIDYKTGGSFSRKNVETGEDVQLLTYAQLMPETRELIYLLLDKTDGVNAKVSIDETQLEELTPQLEQRLEILLESLLQGTPLPAWGDEKTCGYCEFIGLCRRESWI